MSAPVTRDLAELVRACEIVEAELGFQSDRLAQVDPGHSKSNPDHIRRTQEEYAAGRRIVGKLRRYQERRHARQGEGAGHTQPEPEWDVFEEVTEANPFTGPAAAHVGER